MFLHIEICLTDIGNYDFIIVGAGAAGTVIAKGLSDIPSVKVLVIEAGGPETDFSDIPGMLTYLQHSRMNWGYTTTSQKKSCLGTFILYNIETRNVIFFNIAGNIDNKCDYPLGKVMGGSSTLSALIYTRGNKEDFNQWERLGNPSWSYKDLLPYFIKQEKSHVKGDKGYHGYNGLLDIEEQKPKLPLTDVFLKSFKEAGMKVVDFNGATQIGAGNARKLTKNGKRRSGGRVFLEPVKSRKNLRVIDNALVTKVLIRNWTTRGVEFVKYGKTYIANARREVIVSCGSINTPQLLMLSGIGPEEELSKHRIRTVRNLPVGSNLKDQIYIPIPFSTNRNFNADLQESIKHFVGGTGVLTNGGVSVLGFIQTESNKCPSQGVPDVEIMFISPNSYFPFRGSRSKYQNLTFPNPANAFSAYVYLLKPKSVGSVKLQSYSPWDFPLINTNFLSDPKNEDVKTYYQAVRFLLKLAQTRSLKDIKSKFVGRNFPPCKKYKLLSREYLYCHARNLGMPAAQPYGTARMGPKGKNSVVDYRLRVHGIKKLRVADASVMPEGISGHPLAAVFVIGQKAVDFILEDNHLKTNNQDIDIR